MTGCEGTTWNAVGAAGSLSQLAGVIGGFVFAGIIVLLSQPRNRLDSPDTTTRDGAARLRALIPFFATFVAMGLNAYVFALLGGENGVTQVCRRVWTATFAASGMLAIGVVSAICGIMLLVHAYLARHHLSPNDIRHLVAFDRTLWATLSAFCVIVPVLLAQRGYEYLRVWYHGQVHGLHWLGFALAVVLVAVAFVAIVRRRFDNDHLLNGAAALTVAFSIACTAIVGFFLGVIPGDWEAAPAFVPWTFAGLVLVVPSVAVVGYFLAVRGIRSMHADPEPEH